MQSTSLTFHDYFPFDFFRREKALHIDDNDDGIFIEGNGSITSEGSKNTLLRKTTSDSFFYRSSVHRLIRLHFSNN